MSRSIFIKATAICHKRETKTYPIASQNPLTIVCLQNILQCPSKHNSSTKLLSSLPTMLSLKVDYVPNSFKVKNITSNLSAACHQGFHIAQWVVRGEWRVHHTWNIPSSQAAIHLHAEDFACWSLHMLKSPFWYMG